MAVNMHFHLTKGPPVHLQHVMMRWYKPFVNAIVQKRKAASDGYPEAHGLLFSQFYHKENNHNQHTTQGPLVDRSCKDK